MTTAIVISHGTHHVIHHGEKNWRYNQVIRNLDRKKKKKKKEESDEYVLSSASAPAQIIHHNERLGTQMKTD